MRRENPGDFEAEVKQSLDNIGVVLKEAGIRRRCRERAGLSHRCETSSG